MSGKEIKWLILSNGVLLWQVAEALGKSDSSFSRRLRKPFSDEEVTRIRTIIDKLKKEGK